MNEISKTIVEQYEIRKNKKQKAAFREYIVGEAERLGYKASVESGSFGVKNIVFGDTQKASIVFGAHYDTCAVMPFPNFITPRNIFVFIVYQLLLCVVMFIIPAALTGLVIYFTGVGPLAALVWMVSLLGMCFLMMAGPANKHTMNDNTSGVLSVVELMSALPTELRGKAAFVLFDAEELGLIGSSSFAKSHKELSGKLLINLDCVGDGDTVLLVPRAAVRKDASAMSLLSDSFSPTAEMNAIIDGRAIYPSDQASFKRGVGVAALKKGALGIYMDRIHTRRDTVCEQKNIDYIVASSINLIKNV